MTVLLARLAEDQPVGPPLYSHPGWCAMGHGDNNSHAGRYVQAEGLSLPDPETGERVRVMVGVIVLQRATRPYVWVNGREYLPEDARAFAHLLSVLGHAVLSAVITRAVAMAEGSVSA